MCKCKNWVEYSYSISINNKSKFSIAVYIAMSEKNAYPDTSLSFDKSFIEHTIKPGNIADYSYPLLTIEERVLTLPKDTLSIYIFNKDALDTYPWEVIQRDYKILQRYDLSIEDIHKLKNKYDVPEIPYPPTEVMKNMKMYPPYQ
jgi:hypothetical protein